MNNLKQILILSLLAVPFSAMAQSEWELPNQAKKQDTVNVIKKADGASKNAKRLELKIDKKYAEGAVPEVDGKVEWTETIECPGMTAEEIYSKALDAITELTQSKEQISTEKSRISAVNRKDHIIAAHLEEHLVFSVSTFSKDQTDLRYSLIANCFDGKVELKLCRISYAYEMHRDNGSIYKAEEWITDSAALNKNKTNVYRLNGKFRIKTIDRKDELFEMFRKAMAK